MYDYDELSHIIILSWVGFVICVILGVFYINS